ncbi:MAG: hypothetical protein ACYDHG_02745 [Desulfomonilaceae bacterium]
MALPHSTLGIGGAFSASRLTERWSLLSQEAGLQVECPMLGYQHHLL